MYDNDNKRFQDRRDIMILFSLVKRVRWNERKEELRKFFRESHTFINFKIDSSTLDIGVT